ncbi:hypothetical protein GCM10009628_06450 [Paeniglutamicibacter kerguelensis]
MKVLNASEDGRCERLFTRSSRGWSLPVVVVASVLMVQSSQSATTCAKALSAERSRVWERTPAALCPARQTPGGPRRKPGA